MDNVQRSGKIKEISKVAHGQKNGNDNGNAIANGHGVDYGDPSCKGNNKEKGRRKYIRWAVLKKMMEINIFS